MLAKQRSPKLFAKGTRILIIHTKYIEGGGESTVVQNELMLLRRNGFTVKELYFNNQKLTGLKALLMPFNFISFFRVMLVCLKYKPALVHIHNMHFAASPAIIWAVRLQRIPIVKTLHNYRLLCPSAILFSNGALYLKSLNKSFPWQAVKDGVYRNSGLLTFWLAFSNWIHRKIGTWRMVSKYIVFTSQGRQLMLNSGLGLTSNQVVIKPNCSHKNIKPPMRRNEGFLYVGRLSQEKGIDILLAAFVQNGLPLTIIGDGPYAPLVKRAIEQNPLIKWLGHQTSDIVQKELKKCAALIFPSICYEGMPLSIIEAFASNTAVIASRLGAMEKMVEHNYNGLLFEAGNAAELNAQLRQWQDLSNIEKNDIRKNALKTFEDTFSPEKNSAMLLSIYSSLLSRRQNPAKERTNHKSRLLVRNEFNLN